MKAVEFSNFLLRPGEKEFSAKATVQQESFKYPYCAALHLILANIEKHQHSFYYAEKSLLASIYCTSREVAYNYLNPNTSGIPDNRIIGINESYTPSTKGTIEEELTDLWGGFAQNENERKSEEVVSAETEKEVEEAENDDPWANFVWNPNEQKSEEETINVETEKGVEEAESEDPWTNLSWNSSEQKSEEVINVETEKGVEETELTDPWADLLAKIKPTEVNPIEERQVTSEEEPYEAFEPETIEQEEGIEEENLLEISLEEKAAGDKIENTSTEIIFELPKEEDKNEAVITVNEQVVEEHPARKAKLLDDNQERSFSSWLRKMHHSAENPQKIININIDPDFVENVLHLSNIEAEDIPTIKISFDLSKKEDYLIEKFIREKPIIKATELRQLSFEDKSKHNIIDNEEVATETLANIFIEQGLFDKAIQTYQKLIVRYPEKNAYFRVQIEKIKQEKSL